MKNPLYPMLSDAQYQCLVELKLLRKNMLRDFELKRRYLNLKKTKERAGADEIFSQLHEEYPKLRTETIKKIVYSTRLPEEILFEEKD